MKKNLDVNLENIRGLINDLSGKELKKAQRQGLKKSASILVKETKKQLKNSIPKASKKGNKKYSDKLVDAVRSSVDDDTKKEPFFKVHILGHRKKGSGTFRTRFFEKGTQERYTYSRKKVSTNRNSIPEYIRSPKTGKLIKNKAWYGRAKNNFKTSRTKKSYRGHITGKRFFRKAQSIAENEVFDSMEKNLTEAIIKISRKW